MVTSRLVLANIRIFATVNQQFLVIADISSKIKLVLVRKILGMKSLPLFILLFLALACALPAPNKSGQSKSSDRPRITYSKPTFENAAGVYTALHFEVTKMHRANGLNTFRSMPAFTIRMEI